ncbi:MAG: HD-GYP domain-containing protein, partial [Lachnospiraceae bacterium]|nr:HD-GYP domain-containing protein [Lachnospiraceae bacterium]
FSLMIAVWTTLQVQTAEIEREQKIIDLNEAVEGERKRNLQIAMQTIISICHAVEAKDPYTNEHSLRVARYVKMIAQELGWDEEKQRNIYVASLMHDIGKIGVPDEILKKPDHLTDEESKIIKRHPEIGYSIMKDFNAIENAAEGVLYHHERYDGKGYPRQLKGEQIPLYGRIIAVADAFDAMNSNRIYRQAGQKEYIVEQIRNGIGTQFDPKIAEIFLKLIEEGKITFWEEDEKNIDF